MTNVTSYIHFVKTQIAFHASKAAFFGRSTDKFPTNAKRSEQHQKMVDQFTSLLDYLENASLQSIAPGHRLVSSKLGLSPEEIEGLPPELLEELSISEADKADFAVLAVVDDAGGVLSLDKMLIALYRKTGEINKRATLNSRIYRMVQKGSMFNVPGRKGIYSTRELTEEEASLLS